jgi:DNA-binding CsgD family transcriptional regulator
MLRLCAAEIRVPEDIFVMSFGDFHSLDMLYKMFGSDSIQTEVTTVTVDHFELGRQTVALFSYLKKNNSEKSDISVSVKISSDFHLSESTGFLPEKNAQIIGSQTDYASHDFYNDEEVNEILRLEAFALVCDKTDIEIIRLLNDGCTLPDIAERSFISESAVVYRLKRIYGILQISNKNQLILILKKYMLI